MKAMFLTDLDDTLFQTARKMDEAQMMGAVPASFLDDGSISGYRTVRQQFLMELMATAETVPVTARSRKVLARAEVPQAPAICSHGGLIIREDGKPDAQWQEILRKDAGRTMLLKDIMQDLETGLDARTRRWIVSEEGDDLYLVVKSNIDDGEILDDVKEMVRQIAPDGFMIHVNGNNLALLPDWLSKTRAVEHLIADRRKADPDLLVIGAGDSLSDLGFMHLCDFSLYPGRSQIASAIQNNIIHGRAAA